MASDLLQFALMALTGHRLRTSLCVLGVAVGITAVVMLTALGEGARRYVINEFSIIGTNLLGIIPGKTETTGALPGVGGVPHDLTLDDVHAVRRGLPSAQLVVPMSMGAETASHGERRRQIAVVGTTTDFLPLRDLHLEGGRFLPPGEIERGASVVVLGKKVAQELFPGETPIGRVVRIGDWRMRVIGVLAERGTHFGVDMDEIVVVPVATGMRMFNRTSLFRILVKIRSPRELQTACDHVVAILIEQHGEEDVTCITQDAVVNTFSTILRTFTLVLAALGGISLAVAGIGIMNVMLVTVSERTEEVGLLRALGASKGQVLAVFLAESILIAGAGGVAGILIGWGAIYALVTMYPVFPASPPLWALVGALVVSVGLGGIFGVMPARRAARMDPILALMNR